MRVAVIPEPDDSGSRLEIPWESPDPAIQYFDLRKHPGAVNQMEEPRRYLPLRNFLVAVNSPDSIFSTVKCGTWLHQDENRGEAEPCEFASALDLIFAHDDFNFERGRYADLTKRLEELLAREPSTEALRAELCVRRCHFRARNRGGFYLTIFLYARGGAAEQAELRWGLGLVRMQQALLFLSRVIRHQFTQAS